MIELKNYITEDFGLIGKSDKILLVCDESSITCATFRQIQQAIGESDKEVILAMPGYEYQKGVRGWAKAHILASVVPQIKGIMTLNYEETLDEIQKGEWGEVQVNGNLVWSSHETIKQPRDNHLAVQIRETSDPFDIEMVTRSVEIIEKSNCWLDPAGAVFVRNEVVVMESTSTSFNDSNCSEIPIDFRELKVNAGERILFCDSLHAERVGISKASRVGIPLTNATMYVSKFPCRPCAMSAIAAGVTIIVYKEGSYGLIETADLFNANNITLKRIVVK